MPAPFTWLCIRARSVSTQDLARATSRSSGTVSISVKLDPYTLAHRHMSARSQNLPRSAASHTWRLVSATLSTWKPILQMWFVQFLPSRPSLMAHFEITMSGRALPHNQNLGGALLVFCGPNALSPHKEKNTTKLPNSPKCQRLQH